MEEVDETMYDIIEEDHVIEETIDDDYSFMDQMQSEEYEMEEEHLEEEEVEQKPIILNSLPSSSGIIRNPQSQIVKGTPGQLVIYQSGSGGSYPVKLIAQNNSGSTQVISQPRQPPQASVQIVKKTITSPVYQRTIQQPKYAVQPKYIVKREGQQLIMTSPPHIKTEPSSSTSITREVIGRQGNVTISRTTHQKPQTVINMRPQTSVKQFVSRQPTILNKTMVRTSPNGGYQTKVVPKQVYKVTSPGTSQGSPGKSVQYIRVVNPDSSPQVLNRSLGSPSGVQRSIISKPGGSYTLVSSTPKPEPQQIVHRRITPKQTQKMIAVVKKDRDGKPVPTTPGKTTVLTTSQLSQIKGVNIIPGNNSKTKIVMLPSNYLEQLREIQNKTPNRSFISKTAVSGTVRKLKEGFGDSFGKKRRCNCTKSQCLKLYCDCFAAGEFCSNCNCKDCQNDQDNEEERQKAIRTCLERNPLAFKPKIKEEDTYRLHQKGCNCKRSGCLKNYCECYEAKVTCSGQCKCIGCHNFDPAMAEEKEQAERELQMNKEKQAIHNKRAAMETAQQLGGAGPKQPYNFMTPDVIEATVQCMLAQAEECQKREVEQKVAEKLILEEFGRCLVEIINFSVKNEN